MTAASGATAMLPSSPCRSMAKKEICIGYRLLPDLPRGAIEPALLQFLPRTTWSQMHGFLHLPSRSGICSFRRIRAVQLPVMRDGFTDFR